MQSPKIELTPLRFIPSSIFCCIVLFLFFILLREIVVFVFGSRWYTINGEWTLDYTLQLVTLILFFVFIAMLVRLKQIIEVWLLRRKVVVNRDDIADYSPRKAVKRAEFSEATKDAVIKRTLRECGNKLLDYYTGREVCFENQINLNGFTADDKIEFDHPVPPCFGGDNSPKNCVIASRKTNRIKHDDIKPPFQKAVLAWLKRHGKTIHKDCLQ